ncbi:MAG: flippase-like domain-containing protein [PVC group bacterium]|nr:flippase-like domain-containing protein [PVC group bacterium]
MNKKQWFLLVRIFVSLFLLGMLFWLMREKISGLGEVFSTINPWIFFGAFCIFNSLLVTASLRLKLLLGVNDIKFTMLESMKLVLIGFFFNNFMPSTIGGDVVKLYYVKKRSQGMIKPLSSIFADRLVGLAGMVSLAMVMLLLKGSLIKHSLVPWIIYGIFVVFLIIALFFSSKKISSMLSRMFKYFGWTQIEQKWQKAYNTLSGFHNSKELVFAFCLSVFSWVIMSVGIYVLALSLSLNVPVDVFLILIPVVSIISCLPSINGLGIREGAFVYFFKDFMLPEQALALSLLYLANLMFGSFLGGIIYMFSGGFKKEEKDNDDKQRTVGYPGVSGM